MIGQDRERTRVECREGAEPVAFDGVEMSERGADGTPVRVVGGDRGAREAGLAGRFDGAGLGRVPRGADLQRVKEGRPELEEQRGDRDPAAAASAPPIHEIGEEANSRAAHGSPHERAR